MVCERGRWCLSRSCGGQPKRHVTRSAVTLSPSVQNNTRNQLLLWESLQHQGPDWEPVYPCIVQPCTGRTYTHISSVTSLSSILLGVCRLTAVIVTTTSHLLLSTVTTKPAELFLKVWTKRPELHFCCCLWSHAQVAHRPPAVRSLTAYCAQKWQALSSSYWHLALSLHLETCLND